MKPPDYDDGAKKLGTMKSSIVQPSGEEMEMALAKNICGQCRHWDHAEGQAQIESTKFMSQLTEEFEWQSHHLAADPKAMGFCGAHNSGAKGESRMLTPRFAVACEGFQGARGLVTLHRKGEY